MKVTVAKACGFCYGVRRAVDMANGAAPGTHTLGPIIHNPQVVNTLSEKGVCPVQSIEDIKDGSTVLIRSHGVGPEIYKRADEKHLHVMDATCPHVMKAQRDAKKLWLKKKN